MERDIPGTRKLEKGDLLQPEDFFIGEDGMRRNIPSMFLNTDPTLYYPDNPITFYRPVKK